MMGMPKGEPITRKHGTPVAVGRPVSFPRTDKPHAIAGKYGDFFTTSGGPRVGVKRVQRKPLRQEIGSEDLLECPV